MSEKPSGFFDSLAARERMFPGRSAYSMPVTVYPASSTAAFRASR